MAYLRDPLLERSETLPNIRDRPGLLDMPHRRGVTTLDDAVYSTDRHVRFSTANGLYGGREPPLYPRPLSPTSLHSNRRQLAELQDQVNLFKDEMAKKDRLISQLSSLDPKRSFTSFDSTKIEELYSSDRLAAAATARAEVASLQVRVDSLQSQLRECQSQLDQKDAKIRELTLHLETSRENDAKSTAVITQLRARMVELEAQAGSIEGAASRGELAVQTLQTQLKQSQDRVLELESRLRTHLEDKEKAEQALQLVERRLAELSTQFTGILHVEDLTLASASASTIDHVVARLTEIVQENAMLKGKLVTMKEYVNNADVEAKASRETIARLVSEAEREQRSYSKYSLEVDNLRVERDNAVAKAADLEKEICSLKDRLDASQRAWTATRQELETREGHLSLLDREARDTILAARSAESQLKAFKEQLAAMLTDSYATVEPYEEQIREKIRQLQLGNRDKAAHIEMLEGKMSTLNQQLDSQLDMHRSSSHASRKLEVDVVELEDRLRRAERELAATEVLRDNMRSDKETYLRSLEDISVALKLDNISRDMGMDMIIEGILARIAQLVRLENDAVIDRTTHIHNLQRKVKTLKEQIESKDLHMDLLRKKVASLEERLVGKSELERESDSERLKARKLVKLVERYKRELNEARLEIRDLKSRLLESSDLRSRTIEQERELERLEAKVGQLEHVRSSQARKISGLKEQHDILDQEIHTKKARTENTIGSLSSELRTTKKALDEVTKRERQLLDLRAVLARMLGLDVNTLAVPDYEIIARLEKLILAQQTNSATVTALDTALSDMGEGFRAGYEDANRVFTTRPVSPTRRSRPRTRSVSPVRRRDMRAY